MGAIQPLRCRFESPRTTTHMWYLKGRFVPVSGNDANGDGKGRFVPVSDGDEDSSDDADGDGEGWFLPVSDNDDNDGFDDEDGKM